MEIINCIFLTCNVNWNVFWNRVECKRIKVIKQFFNTIFIVCLCVCVNGGTLVVNNGNSRVPCVSACLDFVFYGEWSLEVLVYPFLL